MARRTKRTKASKRKSRRLSRQQRIVREREILARFDFENRPALLAARRARELKKAAATAKKRR
jgi:hypothetical protein